MTQRFSALDLIRGLAAIAVITLHYAQFLGLNWFPRAWMAVDLFFVISGFVLTHVYSTRIVEGQLTFTSFIKLRLIRLMPLFWVGLLFGAFSMSYACQIQRLECSSSIIASSILGFLVLPYISDVIWPVGDTFGQFYFPLNLPSWSLFFEFFVNIIFFWWLQSTKGRHLLKLSAFGFFLLVATYHFNGSVNVGFSPNSFFYGFARVFYHFFIGILIYTHHKKYGFDSKLILFIALIILVLTYMINSSLTGGVSLFLISPFLVLLSSKVSFNGLLLKISTWLGNISYPLYITHMPVFQLLYLSGYFEGLAPIERYTVLALFAILTAWILFEVDKTIRLKVSVFLT